MKPLHLILVLVTLLAFAQSEPVVVGKQQQSPYFYSLPFKGGNKQQLAFTKAPNGKQKTLVVQIRSDQPVPLVFKGRPTMAHLHSAQNHAAFSAHPHFHAQAAHSHVHHHINAGGLNHVRQHPIPLKLTGPIYFKNPQAMFRKPLKIKLTNSKTKTSKPIRKPHTSYDAPFKYETASTTQSYGSSELQKLPLESHASFISHHFAPIHTIPAPNLSLHDNHLQTEELHSSPKPQVYHQKKNNYYQVIEDNTNDHTVLDPFSGSQKLFAPDPDPSLPAAKLRPSTEIFNTPSNGKPLPADVESHHRPVAQPLVQIVGAEAAKHPQIAPQIVPIQFNQHSALQPFVGANVAVPIYNPTYLVTQSNNLYSQHRQQLFKPAEIAAASVLGPVIETGYVNADLTQEVASNGQILQAAKDPRNNIHPVLDISPHLSALIAAPSLDQEVAPFQLQNIAAAAVSPSSGTTESGFVISNYYGNAHQDSSQLLQSYAQEENALTERQQQQQSQHLLALQQHHQQLQQHASQQQHQQHQQQQQQQQQHQYQPQPQRLQQELEPSNNAFEEHERLVKQQLGADTPLRIFVPDEEEARLQKRSDNLPENSYEEAENMEGVEAEQPTPSDYEIAASAEASMENRIQNFESNNHEEQQEFQEK